MTFPTHFNPIISIVFRSYSVLLRIRFDNLLNIMTFIVKLTTQRCKIKQIVDPTLILAPDFFWKEVSNSRKWKPNYQMIVIIVMTHTPFFFGHNLIYMEKTVFQFWRHKFLYSILKNYTRHKSPTKCGQNHFRRKLKRFFPDSLEKSLTP
jgi:hypothetical protein